MLLFLEDKDKEIDKEAERVIGLNFDWHDYLLVIASLVLIFIIFKAINRKIKSN